MQAILKFVENLRAKPESHRRVWAFGLSIFFTLLVVIIWIIDLKFTLFSGSQSFAKAPPLSPFAQVAGAVATNIGAVKDGFFVVTSGLVDLFTK